MAFLSEAEVRQIIKDEIAASKELNKLVDLEDQNVATWIEPGTSGANADVTVTRTAEAGKRHHIVGVIATYGGAAAAGILDVSEGATVKISGYAKDTVPLVLMLSKPYKCAVNTAVSAKLGAGGAGAVGRVNLIGFTI
jgi:hypothetical protein